MRNIQRQNRNTGLRRLWHNRSALLINSRFPCLKIVIKHFCKRRNPISLCRTLRDIDDCAMERGKRSRQNSKKHCRTLVRKVRMVYGRYSFQEFGSLCFTETHLAEVQAILSLLDEHGVPNVDA